MKVYIVERGEYSDTQIVGAFSSRERAVAFVEFDINRIRYQDAYEIYEMEIDEPKVTSENDLFYVYNKNGIWNAMKSNVLGWKRLGVMCKHYVGSAEWSGSFFAKDKDHAIKMAQDAYAKMKAEVNGL